MSARPLLAGVVPITLLLAAVAGTAQLAYANCATDDPDGSKTLAARQQVVTDCVCDQTDPPAVNHGQYVKCAAIVANTRAALDPSDPNFLPRRCKGAVKKCAARSVCGKPGFVTCCITRHTVTKCKTKKDAPTCEAKSGVVGTCTSCCDACPAPGSGLTCPAPSTTTTTTPTTSTTTTTTSSTTTTTIFPPCDIMSGEPCGSCGSGQCGLHCTGALPCPTTAVCVDGTSFAGGCSADAHCPPGAICIGILCYDTGLCTNVLGPGLCFSRPCN